MDDSSETQPERGVTAPSPDPGEELPGQPAMRQTWQHLRASEWYESQGEIEAAIEHALAGRDWWRGAYLVNQQADDLLGSGQIEDLRNWLAALPGEALWGSPRLVLIQVHLELSDHRLERAGQLLEEIARKFAGLTDLVGARRAEWDGMLAGVQAELALLTGRLELALELAEKALADLPLSRPVWRALAAGWAAEALYRSGGLKQACDWFARSRQAANLAGSQALALSAGLMQIECLRQLGRWHEALDLCQELVTRWLAEGKLDQTEASRLYSAWAVLLSVGGQLDKALAAGLHAQRLAVEPGTARAEADLALAQVYLARRDYQAARDSLDGAQNWPEKHARQAAVLRIDIDLCSDQSENAARAFDNLGIEPYHELPGEPFGVRRLAARLLLVQGQARQALKRLETLYREELHSDRELSVVETLVLLALAQQAMEDEQACLDALTQALFLAAPQGLMLPFLKLGRALSREMTRLLYRAATQGIQPDFISQLLERIPPE